ncbi:hypothetical protein RUND412_007412 [Rhizina undulata]
MYIPAVVEGAEVDYILIDGGAMIELIGSNLVIRLGLKSFVSERMDIYMADDSVMVLDSYMWLHVVVAGVGGGFAALRLRRITSNYLTLEGVDKDLEAEEAVDLLLDELEDWDHEEDVDGEKGKERKGKR